MNRLAQFGLILGMLFFGGFLQSRFNLPIPSTIVAMITLLVLMIFKIIKLKWVEDIGNALINNLSVLFIPAGVAIVRELDVFKGQVIALAIIILVSTIVTIVVTGYTVQTLEIKKEIKRDSEKRGVDL